MRVKVYVENEHLNYDEDFDSINMNLPGMPGSLRITDYVAKIFYEIYTKYYLYNIEHIYFCTDRKEIQIFIKKQPMNKYIIKYFFAHNNKFKDDYAIRTGNNPDDVKLDFIDQFRKDNHNIAICVTNINKVEEYDEKIDLKVEIEKLKTSAKEMLETLEKIKL